MSDPSSLELHVMTPDGRLLEATVTGPDHGDVVVFHHGTPGAGVVLPTLADAAALRGLRTLFYSRPGYGTSSPRTGRHVAEAALDTSYLLHHLGVDRFLSLGWSGGGPHALACAALLRDRCRAVALVGSVAPYDAQDGGLEAQWTAGMGEANVLEFAAAAAGAPALEKLLAETDREGITREGVLAELDGLLSPVDVAAFTGDLADYMVDGMRHGVVRGTAGWRDDDLAFMAPWGFDVTAIETPVLVAYGGEDRMVPPQHGSWLAAHLPHHQEVLALDHGHLSLMSDPQWVLDRLLEIA
jgi:pimeloyl-ACP methyl ester carboxylesterase